jgi:hypothetical protein
MEENYYLLVRVISEGTNGLFKAAKTTRGKKSFNIQIRNIYCIPAVQQNK